MHYTKFQSSQFLSSGEEDFLGVFTLYGQDCHLDQQAGTI